jgi:hypothetical protein
VIARQLHDAGVVVDPNTGTPLWDGTRWDLGMAVDSLIVATSRSSPPEGSKESN